MKKLAVVYLWCLPFVCFAAAAFIFIRSETILEKVAVFVILVGGLNALLMARTVR